MECPYQIAVEGGDEKKPLVRCSEIERVVGWQHYQSPRACEACAADLLAPKTVASRVCRASVTRLLGARVAGLVRQKDEGDTSIDVCIEKLARLVHPRAVMDAVESGVAREAIAPAKALAIGAQYGFDRIAQREPVKGETA